VNGGFGNKKKTGSDEPDNLGRTDLYLMKSFVLKDRWVTSNLKALNGLALV
jgi:hypothetical protein